MEILYITDMNPFSCSFGGEQRAHYLYEALKRIGNVYLLQVNPFSRSNQDNLLSIRLRPPRGLGRYVNSLYARIRRRLLPVCHVDYLPCSMLWEPKNLFPGVKFDLIVFSEIHNVGYMHAWEIAPVIVDINDDPIELFDTMYHLGRKGRFLRFFNVMLLKHILNKTKGAWIANGESIEKLPTRRPIQLLENIPRPIPSFYKAQDQLRDNYIFTVGSLFYKPNCQGIDVFLQKVWPVVHARYPDLNYKIAGKGLSNQYLQKWSQVEGVQILGFVNDLSAVYQKALAAVVPIQSGSGTCIKTLEALSHSRVCLTTKFGARGLPISSHDPMELGLLVYDSAESFLRLFMSVVAQPFRRRDVEENGRRFVEASRSEANFFRQVQRLVISAVGNGEESK